MNSCENCIFAWAMKMPDPLPELPKRNGFVKFLIGNGESSLWAIGLHDIRVDRALNKRLCRRFPREELVSKTYLCGEYKADNNDQ